MVQLEMVLMPQLVILSPQEFVSSLAPLRDFKAATGVSAELVSLETVISGWPGRDDPERVKRFLEDRVRNSGTKYVLLVGDGSKFPLRYTKGQHIEHPDVNPQGGRVTYSPTDLYYADLFEPDGSFDDWDRNHNGEFGELQGEWTAGTLNVDDLDLSPDVAVGRLPARTSPEVERYIHRIIAFEAGMPQAWAKSALLIATTDWDPDACKVQDHIASQCLTGYQVHRLYDQGNPCGISTSPSATEISRIINQGVGMVNYIGHGSADGWSPHFWRSDLAKLSNHGRPPVVFAAACDTSWFAKNVPYDSYVDEAGVAHQGVNSGEIVSLTAPPRPAPIQPGPPVDSMGVDMLVEHDHGATAYLGCITGAQGQAEDLSKYFFEALSVGITTLGGMWRHMLIRYYQAHVPPLAVNPPNYLPVAEFHQPWKFFLFGDPSLRLHGVGETGATLNVEGIPTYLRVHDVGTGYGPADDHLDVEVVVKLANIPDRAFGLQLRVDQNKAAATAMLDLLRRAFNDQQPVNLDYVRTGFLNGRIIRIKAMH